MAIRGFLHPVLALFLFMVGILMANTVHLSFGLIMILGGLMLGFSPIRNDIPFMNKKAKSLFYVSFIFLLLLISSTFLVIITVIT
ncbi:hypothetical protein DCC39_15425 [Pueribacillus theae]|uniref:Uncharacterized protein n=1 Tax=Pueribacillus theae TaxID=2171751 RepID=A0A2U1JT94_9BACI|nr:hypothetical protein [Pueribacillus theae]PWA08174.1 hypothetical protein DCC39_15425 [Pueribacillus theae]